MLLIEKKKKKEPLTQELSNITYNIMDSDLEVINQVKC